VSRRHLSKAKREARTAELAKIPEEAAQRIWNVVARTFRGIHHCPGGWENREPWGDGISIVAFGGMSTYDFDYLTRLVVAAHDECVRVDVIGCAPSYMRIGLTARKNRDGEFYDRHDTIETAIEKARRC
jgi:hypothetical protein